MDKHRTERIEIMLDEEMDPEDATELAEAGVTLQDAADVVGILRLQLELGRTINPDEPSWRSLVDDFVANLDKDM